MATVLFYEETDPTQLTVAAYQDGKRLWRHTTSKMELQQWLKQSEAEGVLSKNDVRVAVVSERDVCRQFVKMSPALTSKQRRSMAENKVMPIFGGKAGAVRQHIVGRAEDGQDWVAITAIKESACEAWRQWFGSGGRALQWVAAADCLQAFGADALVDGYYVIEAPLWTTVVAVKEQSLIASMTDTGREWTALQYALSEQLQGVGLPNYPQMWKVDEGAALDEATLATSLCHGGRRSVLSAFNGDKKMMALMIGCIVVPGLLWLGLQGRESGQSVDSADGGTQSQVVARSDYSALVGQAYMARSERIVLLSHEAADGCLSIHGRCAETLDLADYMKRLDAAEMALHPLLLDLSKKTDQEKYYYEFVVQISLSGRVSA